MAVLGRVPPPKKPAENPAGIQAELPLHMLNWQQGIASLPTGFSRSLDVPLGPVDCAEGVLKIFLGIHNSVSPSVSRVLLCRSEKGKHFKKKLHVSRTHRIILVSLY